MGQRTTPIWGSRLRRFPTIHERAEPVQITLFKELLRLRQAAAAPSGPIHERILDLLRCGSGSAPQARTYERVREMFHFGLKDEAGPAMYLRLVELLTGARPSATTAFSELDAVRSDHRPLLATLQRLRESEEIPFGPQLADEIEELGQEYENENGGRLIDHASVDAFALSGMLQT